MAETNPFNGPYTVEGVVAFFENEEVYYHARWVGEHVHQFLMKECVRLFQELIKFVEKNEENLFSKAGFNPNRLSIAFISEKALVMFRSDAIKQIWSLIQGKHAHRFFDGYRIERCAEAGLEALLSLHRYCTSVRAIKEHAEEAGVAFTEFAGVSPTYYSLKCLVDDLPHIQLQQPLSKLLPKMDKEEISELVKDGLSGWKMDVQTFLSLPEKSRKVVHKYLFTNRPILSELEESINRQAHATEMWDRMIRGRDASPKRT